MPNLFWIQDQARRLLNALEAGVDEDDSRNLTENEAAEIEKTVRMYLARIEDFAQGVDIAHEAFEAYEMLAEKRQAQYKAYKEAAERASRRAGRIKDVIQAVVAQHLEMTGEKKLVTDKGTYKIVNAGGVLPLLYPESWDKEPALAPEKYHRPRIDLDKDALRTDVELRAAGHPVDDLPKSVAFGPRKKRLTFKP